MVAEFTMLSRDKVVRYANSTAAMDDLEGRRDVRPEERVGQFERLRAAIDERASRSISMNRRRPTEPRRYDLMISEDSRVCGVLAHAAIRIVRELRQRGEHDDLKTALSLPFLAGCT
jgi:hypothetical protein